MIRIKLDVCSANLDVYSKVDEVHKYLWLSCGKQSLRENDKILRKIKRQSKEEVQNRKRSKGCEDS